MSLYSKVRHKIEWIWGNKRVQWVIKEKTRYGIYTGEPRKEKIIVSMTTFSARIDGVALCIKSLLRQTMKPDKIILYLGDDVSEDEIPLELKKMVEYGLDIITGCENIRPHKKYYYAMREYPDACIITVDDDIVYERNLIESLYKGHIKYPNAVICRRANQIIKDKSGLRPYREWTPCNKNCREPRFDILPTGAGGVLYPPHCMIERVFNLEEIKELCLNTDDIWLRYMAVMNKRPVLFVKPLIHYLAEVPGSQKKSLNTENIGNNKNDECLRKMEKYFGIYVDGTSVK